MPSLSDDRRVGRLSEHGFKFCTPIEHIKHQGPTHIMRIVGVSVVSGAMRDDGSQGGWRFRRHLEGIEPAPGLAAHSHGAAGPALSCQPCDDLDCIRLFLRQIFIRQDSVRFP